MHAYRRWRDRCSNGDSGHASKPASPTTSGRWSNSPSLSSPILEIDILASSTLKAHESPVAVPERHPSAVHGRRFRNCVQPCDSSSTDTPSSNCDAIPTHADHHQATPSSDSSFVAGKHALPEQQSLPDEEYAGRNSTHLAEDASAMEAGRRTATAHDDPAADHHCMHATATSTAMPTCQDALFRPHPLQAAALPEASCQHDYPQEWQLNEANEEEQRMSRRQKKKKSKKHKQHAGNDDGDNSNNHRTKTRHGKKDHAAKRALLALPEKYRRPAQGLERVMHASKGTPAHGHSYGGAVGGGGGEGGVRAHAGIHVRAGHHADSPSTSNRDGIDGWTEKDLQRATEKQAAQLQAQRAKEAAQRLRRQAEEARREHLLNQWRDMVNGKLQSGPPAAAASTRWSLSSSSASTARVNGSSHRHARGRPFDWPARSQPSSSSTSNPVLPASRRTRPVMPLAYPTPPAYRPGYGYGYGYGYGVPGGRRNSDGNHSGHSMGGGGGGGRIDRWLSEAYVGMAPSDITPSPPISFRQMSSSCQQHRLHRDGWSAPSSDIPEEAGAMPLASMAAYPLPASATFYHHHHHPPQQQQHPGYHLPPGYSHPPIAPPSIAVAANATLPYMPSQPGHDQRWCMDHGNTLFAPYHTHLSHPGHAMARPSLDYAPLMAHKAWHVPSTATAAYHYHRPDVFGTAASRRQPVNPNSNSNDDDDDDDDQPLTASLMRRPSSMPPANQGSTQQQQQLQRPYISMPMNNGPATSIDRGNQHIDYGGNCGDSSQHQHHLDRSLLAESEMEAEASAAWTSVGVPPACVKGWRRMAMEAPTSTTIDTATTPAYADSIEDSSPEEASTSTESSSSSSSS
ncbi:hypothetical protein SYNPS1DRAFT_27109 [Syncephalis pseudoplumigaleata]|uniref:Uncharacterized protein n=1 Tax=Syncephalis pseudoplumigaleata TaxID=1712513 RepID=A0A4P9Z6D7_9FUNG|nr:hypothetical protein SYNPS1DRAFT_27109 [Syncephalis pseudoplumigaleata]|eukprot:RKP27230.1 hypothetical protein SYNPS1DRAFT_27109 [Syncephalis pseudoplumigaleata]